MRSLGFCCFLSAKVRKKYGIDEIIIGIASSKNKNNNGINKKTRKSGELTKILSIFATIIEEHLGQVPVLL
jgi:hypothetical protein